VSGSLDQRFYASSYGRFNTPDPYVAGGAASGSVSNPSDPGSWNRYAYTRGDPINRFDPGGTDDCAVIFADASVSYDPYSSCSGAQGNCANIAMAFAGYQDDPTLWADAEAMGCTDAGPSDFVQTQGTANRNGDLTVAYSNDMGGSFQHAITSMLQNIEGAFAANPKCNTWLSSSSMGSATTVINTLIQYNSYGSGDFFIDGVQTYTIAGAEGGHNLDGTPTGILGAFAINAEGAFFNSTAPGGGTLRVGAAKYVGGTPQAQAAILIHELGHILGLLGPDYGNNGAGAANDKSVAANCAGLINSLGKN
jgi:RHS repeat-associated protein